MNDFLHIFIDTSNKRPEYTRKKKNREVFLDLLENRDSSLNRAHRRRKLRDARK